MSTFETLLKGCDTFTHDRSLSSSRMIVNNQIWHEAIKNDQMRRKNTKNNKNYRKDQKEQKLTNTKSDQK